MSSVKQDVLESLRLTSQQRAAILDLVEDAAYVALNMHHCQYSMKQCVQDARNIATARLPVAV